MKQSARRPLLAPIGIGGHRPRERGNDTQPIAAPNRPGDKHAKARRSRSQPTARLDSPDRRGHEPAASRRKVSKSSETAEKVRARIRKAVLRQLICLDASSKARRTAARMSRFGVDRIAVDDIDFFSGLVEKGHIVCARGLLLIGDPPTVEKLPRAVSRAHVPAGFRWQLESGRAA